MKKLNLIATLGLLAAVSGQAQENKFEQSAPKTAVEERDVECTELQITTTTAADGTVQEAKKVVQLHLQNECDTSQPFSITPTVIRNSHRGLYSLMKHVLACCTKK